MYSRHSVQYFFASEFHGRGGPMRVERAKYHPGLDTVMEAAHEMGYQMKDPNGNQTNGNGSQI